MPVTRMLRLSLVLFVAIACSSDATSPPFRSFVNAVAHAECGPADGPAVAIFLTPNAVGSVEPSAPFVRIYVAVQVAELAGRTWNANTDAAALFYPDASNFEVAESGNMIVTSVDSNSTITGTVDLNFPDAGHIKTAFRATWIPIHALCA